MKSSKKIISISLIIIALLFIGYYRDYIFVSINALLKAWDFGITYTMPASMRFMESSDYDTVVNIKWLLTLLFSIIYFGISSITIYILFKNKKLIFITLWVYLAIITVSAIFIGVGIIFKNTSETMYEFARYLMGMAQSPLILMILIPTFKLSEEHLIKEKK